MIEFYPQIKAVHIAAVMLSGVLFLLRGGAVQLGASWAMAAPLRYLSYTIDTVLLTAALMACGATYALVPFINRKALGGVAGIIGAGGNVGAVAAGFLVKGLSSIPVALFTLGLLVVACAVCTLAVRFTQEQKTAERQQYNDALEQKAAQTQAVADAACRKTRR